MPAFFKRDPVETKAARHDGTLIDKRSYISRPKAVGKPGEPGFHEGPHEKLKGADMRRRYAEILKRDGRSCSVCGCVPAEDDGYTWLELDHIVPKGKAGCECAINLAFKCANYSRSGCHQKRHVQVHWTRRGEAA